MSLPARGTLGPVPSEADAVMTGPWLRAQTPCAFVPELVTRRASITPSSINAEHRTADVIFSTGSRVLRGVFERFYEELSLDRSRSGWPG